MFLAALIHQTKRLEFGTAVINVPLHHPAIIAAEAAQFDHMSKGRFMLGVGPGGLVSDFELFKQTDHAARNRMVVEASTLSRRSGRKTRLRSQRRVLEHQIKDGIMPELGVGFMPKPYRKAAADLDLAREPELFVGPHGRRTGWGMISANIIPTYSVASHWRSAARPAAKPASRAEAPSRAQLAWWRPPTRRLATVCSATRLEPLFLHLHARGAAGSAYLDSQAPGGHVGRRGDVGGDPEECVICGSPNTLLDKLVAFRERVGPFGTLLMTGIDWGGPNAEWERKAMRLLAQEVMPKFRQHVTARAAE